MANEKPGPVPGATAPGSRPQPAPGRHAAAGAARADGRARVLIADDDPHVRDLLACALKSFGHETVTAANGPEAVEVFSARPHEFILVLLGFEMPGLNGEQIFLHLRALRPDLPVILISGYAPAAPLERMRAAGLNAVIHKPFSIGALRAACTRHIDAVQDPAPPPLNDAEEALTAAG
ncbi:MAG: response regulator [Candidatus Marinimicrobia bacterium]|nr:response regulator [Candidatus Neomarinimicrobiota bacterium]